jgi:hypothetical protein
MPSQNLLLVLTFVPAIPDIDMFWGQVGAIQWPLRLHDDAVDHGYQNDTIQTALYEAYSTVFDILVGTQDHPIMSLFARHMKKQRKAFNKKNQNRLPSSNDLLQMAHRLAFSVPILPGDASLTQDFIADIKIQAHREKFEIIDEYLTLILLGSILFHLVILRTYLDRPAENDLDIYELVKENKVSRIWTTHEQALAACHGEDDTQPNAQFKSNPDPDLWEVKVSRDMQLALSDSEPFVSTHMAEPIVWTNRPGLAGGTRKPRRYRPLYIRLAQPGPRPTPRPAYGKHADGLSVKRQREENAEVEIPAKKRRIAGRGWVANLSEEDRMSADSPNSPQVLRRSERTRTAVIF